MSKREDVIYGNKTGDYKSDTYVEIWLRDEDDGFGVCYQHDARGCIWHFLLREADKYNLDFSKDSLNIYCQSRGFKLIKLDKTSNKDRKGMNICDIGLPQNESRREVIL